MATDNVYMIYFWHGRTESHAESLSAFCETDEDGNLWYRGSLDDFVKLYGRHFIVRPQAKDYPNLICVTQYNSWGAR